MIEPNLIISRVRISCDSLSFSIYTKWSDRVHTYFHIDQHVRIIFTARVTRVHHGDQLCSSSVTLFPAQFA